MQITEGVKASQRLINAALNDPGMTLGFEAEYLLIGAQKAIQSYLTQGMGQTPDGNYHTRKIGDTTYSDLLHFWVPLSVDSDNLKDNHEILQERLIQLYEQETGGDGTFTSTAAIWDSLKEKYRMHQLMAMLRAFPKDRILNIDPRKEEALEDIVYDGDVKEITPFGKLNDLEFSTSTVGFEKEEYDLAMNIATQDILYHMVARDLQGKVSGNVVSTADETRTYELSQKYQNWAVTYDASLADETAKSGAAGVETISPIFQAQEGVDQLMNFLQIMNGKIIGLNVATTMDTGLHINIGVKGKQIDALKMLVLLGDQHIVKKFGREMNEFSEPTLRELKKRIHRAGKLQTISSDSTGVLVKFTQKLISHVHIDQSDFQRMTKLLDKINPHGKSYSVNFSTLPSGYIEFRAIGNADYEKRAPEIRDVVLRMLVITHIATNPDAYRQEFLKKIYKIVVQALQSMREEPLTASASVIGRGTRGGYGVPIEDHPLTQFDGEDLMHVTGFDPGSNTQ